MNRLVIPKFRDSAIFCCWIAGLLLIGSLCWFLTRPVRSEFLLRSVNRAWTQSGQTERLQGPIDPKTMKPELSRLGFWYSVDDENQALVFTMMTDGVFLPCAAIVDQQGKVEKILPLNSGGEKSLDRVPEKVLQLYIRRIELHSMEKQS